MREAAAIWPRPCDIVLLTLKAVSESCVTCDRPTSVPILVFLGLSVLDVGPMYETDRQTSDRQKELRHRPRSTGG